LNDKIELYDILVCIESIKYPHTGNNIHTTIISKLTLLDLNDKVKIVVSDNGSNVVKAIHEWEGTERIPCSAHSLQLCVVKALQKIHLYIKRFKSLNNFFNSSKQNERLEEAQRQLINRYESIDDNHNLDNSETSQTSSNQILPNDQTLLDLTNETAYISLKILRTINECNIRWGSEYNLFTNEKYLSNQNSNNSRNNYPEDKLNYNCNFKSCLFDDNKDEIIPENKIDHYLDKTQTQTN
ncbi:12790_t:CDS:2, partial [Racocetra fulgida]